MSKTVFLNSRQEFETKYRNSRANLLFVVAFTVVNILLLVINSNTYFLFSAFIPYVLVILGMDVCGMFPPEYYGDEFSDLTFFNTSVFAVFLVIALIITAVYFLCWIFSKNNRKGWLIAALVMFVIDTAGMFFVNGFALDSIVDIAFHIWVIVSLSLGIHAGHKLKTMPVEEEAAAETEQPATEV